jgi:hypothetical protein
LDSSIAAPLQYKVIFETKIKKKRPIQKSKKNPLSDLNVRQKVDKISYC